ncbi:MAG: glycosyltransferase family 2 protein [Pseudomonadota bacterium]
MTLIPNMANGMSEHRPAPICLFVYNRPWHARRTVESLQENRLARESDLFIFSDGAKVGEDEDKVSEVRRYIQQIDGFRSVSIVEHRENLGLAASVINGVTSILDNWGRIIVLEDDMETSPYFLEYMNDALVKYADDERVVSAHGYVYPLGSELPEAFFLPGADCWGWATWSRGWELFNPDGKHLLGEINRHQLACTFDFNGSFPYSRMLAEQVAGRNDSWAIRWYASAFLAGKLTLYPGRSLVRNIGNDNSGTHCRETRQYESALSMTPIRLDDIEVEPSLVERKRFETYFRQNHPGRIRRMLHSIQKWARAG